MNAKDSLLACVSSGIIALVVGCAPAGPPTWYFDSDMDGYGDAAIVVTAEEQPAQYVRNRADCNDADAAINPDAIEVLDGADNDCDGAIDNVPYWYADTDTDGYGDPEVSLQQPAQPAQPKRGHTRSSVNSWFGLQVKADTKQKRKNRDEFAVRKQIHENQRHEID